MGEVPGEERQTRPRVKSTEGLLCCPDMTRSDPDTPIGGVSDVCLQEDKLGSQETRQKAVASVQGGLERPRGGRGGTGRTHSKHM